MLAQNAISVEKVLKEFGGKNFSTFKSKLSESLVDKILPNWQRNKKIIKRRSLFKITF